MTFKELRSIILQKKSFLCVGLDPQWDKLPASVLRHDSPLFEFCRRIVEATAPYAVAYKINTAFYEAHGAEGWEALERLQAFIGPSFFRIADAKRGDIGNTASQYAQAFFGRMAFDAVTVSPYMGPDTLEPFLSWKEKSLFVLGLTSNEGGAFIQQVKTEDGALLYEKVVRSLATHPCAERIGWVVGATQKKLIPSFLSASNNSFYLIPGVGAQGGTVEDTLNSFASALPNILINSSREILYASDDESFAEKAGDRARQMVEAMMPAFGNSP
ncbi:MAG: orotidine-5'-phosphate decarboxylase [Flavobacteriales bacterium]|nr:orotidine-5'-phosphate decarboxylase [Flavobacteriales bacterium]MDW8431855.1 orotidine-5'-phosphate decarboxylase [Flavobacteriales bacterium]